jgi:hypothetical protein
MLTLSLFLLVAAPTAGAFPAPDCALVPGWTQQGDSRAYDPETLFDYMNGNSEGYFAYGFTLMKGVTCTNAAGDQLVLDVSELADPDRAWGFFVTNRDQRSAVETLGSGGQVLPRRATFAKGRYYVEIAASPDKDHRASLRPFVEAMIARVPGEAHVPEAVSFFPSEGLDAASIRLVPESVLGLRALRTGFVAQYADARAFVAAEKDAATAGAALAKLRGRFPQAAAVAGIGDEGFTAQDQYLGSLVVFRKGQRLGGVANVPPGKDGQPLAKALAARLP